MASKCVSYLTTQAKEKIPDKAALTPPPGQAAKAASSAKPAVGGRPGGGVNSGGFAYGCDICQEACPFNSNCSGG